MSEANKKYTTYIKPPKGQKETWKKLKKYSRYEVSNFLNVRKKIKGGTYKSVTVDLDLFNNRILFIKNHPYFLEYYYNK